ncbi:hypothetical protein H0H93_011996 [Arthromyces matolae]|nr:hypothetical protein H0H93_011996 [Arthromyces matolae]
MDLDDYYREQDERMNLPDEDIDDYLSRIGVHRSHGSILHEQKIKESEVPQTQGGRRNDTEHTNCAIIDDTKTADKTSQKQHGGATDMSMSRVDDDLGCDLQGNDSQVLVSKRKALSIQGEETTPQKKRKTYTPPLTINSIYQDDGVTNRSELEIVLSNLENPQDKTPTSVDTISSIYHVAPREAFINNNSLSPDLTQESTSNTAFSARSSKRVSKVSCDSPKQMHGRSTASLSPQATSTTTHERRIPTSDVQSKPLSSSHNSLIVERGGWSPAVQSSSSSYAPTPSKLTTPRRTSPRKLKRPALQTDEDPAVLPPQKKNRQRATVSPSIEDVEDITSISSSSKGNPSPHQQFPQGKKVVPLKELPALDLKGIQVPSKTTSRRSNAPTSPIEEISIIDSTMDASNLAPNQLYQEVKKRIAAHSSAKRRDKLLKLPLRDESATKSVDALDTEEIWVSSASNSPRSSSPIGAKISTKPSRGLPPSSSKEAKVPKMAEIPKAKGVKGKKKEKPAPVTPEEYAQKLMERVNAKKTAGDPPVNNSKFLNGMNVFYAGGDMTYASERTRGRMDLIARHGGNLLPKYDEATTTHIITDAGALATLRALGLKHLSQIPNRIPTLKWTWMVKAMSSISGLRKNQKVRMEEPFLHAAFVERFEAGGDPRPSKPKGKGKEKVKLEPTETMEYSHISDFTQDKLQPLRSASSRSFHSDRNAHDSEEEEEGDNQDRVVGAPLSPPTSPPRAASNSAQKAGPSKPVKTDDPLAEFYAKARAEAELQVGLEELKALHAAKLGDEDRWRVFSYSKCIRALRNYPKRIHSFAEARSIRGVGEKTAAKIMEIIETGKLRRIGYEKTEDVTITKLFQGVYGVGQSIAYQWYAAGCRSLADVSAGKGGVKLTPAQEIGIRFYDGQRSSYFSNDERFHLDTLADINNRMPREEAKQIFELIKPIALEIDPKLFVEIMGSYRRGKADCGDIDIMITRPPGDGKTHAGVLPKLLDKLHAAGILTEDLALPEDPHDLEAIYRGLCRLPHREGSRRRRIDFLTVPWASRGAALLYYTFNRAIRMKANVLGYSLNQKGLFGGVVRDPRNRRVKLNTGKLNLF